MSDAPWPIWKLSLLLYPFAVGAVAINLFMFALLGQVFGITPLSPMSSLIWGIFLGIPVAWMCGRWARNLMDQADS